MASSSYFDTTSNFGVGSTSPAFDSSKVWSDSFDASKSWSNPSWYESNQFDAGGGFSKGFYEQADTFGRNAFGGGDSSQSSRKIGWGDILDAGIKSAKFLKSYADRQGLLSDSSNLYGGDLKGAGVHQAGDLTFVDPIILPGQPGQPGQRGILSTIAGAAAPFAAIVNPFAGAALGAVSQLA